MQKFRCSKCGLTKDRKHFHETKTSRRRDKIVTSRCRECRSEARFAKLYPDSICHQCLGHRRLDVNGICSPCNEETGLRQCRGACQELLPLYMKFELKRLICRDCWAKLRRERRAHRH